MINKTVLAIDDDPDILNIISIVLKNRGYTVVTDATGQYIDTMKRPFPDLIILDIDLNGYDGRDVCKKLKSLPLTAGIPVMFFSANHHVQTICEDYMANDYLAKPFEISDLLKKVELLAGTSLAV